MFFSSKGDNRRLTRKATALAVYLLMFVVLGWQFSAFALPAIDIGGMTQEQQLKQQQQQQKQQQQGVTFTIHKKAELTKQPLPGVVFRVTLIRDGETKASADFTTDLNGDAYINTIDGWAMYMGDQLKIEETAPLAGYAAIEPITVTLDPSKDSRVTNPMYYEGPYEQHVEQQQQEEAEQQEEAQPESQVPEVHVKKQPAMEQATPEEEPQEAAEPKQHVDQEPASQVPEQHVEQQQQESQVPEQHVEQQQQESQVQETRVEQQQESQVPEKHVKMMQQGDYDFAQEKEMEGQLKEDGKGGYSKGYGKDGPPVNKIPLQTTILNGYEYADFTIIKIDQFKNAVPNAKFKIYGKGTVLGTEVTEELLPPKWK